MTHRFAKCGPHGCDPCTKRWRMWHLVDRVGGGRTGCKQGCGERYVGEYPNDKPLPCEPCDGHGRWIGRGPFGGGAPLRAPYPTPGAGHVPAGPPAYGPAVYGRPVYGPAPAQRPAGPTPAVMTDQARAMPKSAVPRGVSTDTSLIGKEFMVGPVTETHRIAETGEVIAAPKLTPANATATSSSDQQWRPRSRF